MSVLNVVVVVSIEDIPAAVAELRTADIAVVEVEVVLVVVEVVGQT